MKNLDKYIDDKLKQAFDAIQKKAPAHLWDNISQEIDAKGLSDNDLDNSLDEKVQDSFLNQAPKLAPAFLWDKISENLDEIPAVDDVLDKKIQEGFLNQAPKTAPAFLWENISENLTPTAPVSDEVLDEKIKESFEEQPLAKAPNSIWENINRQLNIDKTWSKISKSLDAQPVVSDWRKKMLQFVAAASVLLLFAKTCEDPNKPGFNVYSVSENHQLVEQKQDSKNNAKRIYEYHNPNLVDIENNDVVNNTSNNIASNIVNNTTVENQEKTTTTTVVQKSNIQTNTKNITTVSTTKKSSKGIAKNNGTAVGVVAKNKDLDNLKTNNSNLELGLQNNSNNGLDNLDKNAVSYTILDSDNPTNISNNNPNETAIESNQTFLNWTMLNVLKSGEISTESNTEPILLLDEIALEKKNKKNLIADKLEVGIYTVINSTMLINNDTREGFDEKSLTQNYFGLAANYGVWASYRILPKGSLVAEFAINADNIQAYGVYDQGVYYIKEWQMKSNRISLAYKQDLWSTKGDKLVNTKLVAQGGLYLGILREAKLFYDGELYYDAIGEHHQFDFGFKVALGQEISIDRFVVGYGIRSDIGVTNIFKGNAKVTAQENPTNIIHLGGYLTLGYKF